MILSLETRHTDFDFLATTSEARAVDGTRIPSESAIVRAVVAPNVTSNLVVVPTGIVVVVAGTVVLEVLTGIVVVVAGTVVLVVLVVLVAEVAVVEHSLDVGTNPLIGFPGQPVLPCT